MASMKDIKRRKESIQSTGQITKAMKLVATVKLQKARGRAESAKPYFDAMYETVSTMLARTGDINHRYLKAGDTNKKAIIVITANRGLAGGYNSGITKLVANYGIPKEDMPMYSDAMEIGSRVLKDFEEGRVGEIYLAYTSFKNTVVHTPEMIKLLPMNSSEHKEAKDADDLMTYEPCEEEALDIIIPKYINSLIYGALTESVASENGARMTAMDNATSNAEEMISDLALKYNRARQSSITQELTEIIAGANAIS